jgi:proteic killer suppression protein
MIRSFADKPTAAIFIGQVVRGFPSDIQKRARVKLKMLDAAKDLVDLRNPPGNRLEELKGSRRGQYSIRVNDQWRICFLWKDGEIFEVELVDYH